MSPASAAAVPRVAPKARLQWDDVRNRHVLLYPEGLVILNHTGAEIPAPGIYMLDALNAATFDLLCNQKRGAMVRHAMTGMVTRGAEWRAFVANLQNPQWMMPKSIY